MASVSFVCWRRGFKALRSGSDSADLDGMTFTGALLPWVWPCW